MFRVALLLSGCALAVLAFPAPLNRPEREFTTARGETLTSSGVDICDTDGQSVAGYFTVTSKTLHYFYWFFPSHNDPANDPIVLWMTGGPGCSSELAIFMENGPCKIDKKTLQTSPNPFSWNTNASVIFIDQPAGVGFSYGNPSDYVKDEKGVAADMYNFLQAFFDANAALRKNDFFIFGESYAGHYVPATAHAVFTGTGEPIRLQGMAVGNGLSAPEIQYKYYAPFAVNNSVRPLVSDAVEAQMLAGIDTCVADILKCQKAGGGAACTVALDFCNAREVEPVSSTGINVYDVRIPCEGELCYDTAYIGKYLAQASVQQALGVTGRSWVQCSNVVHSMFEGDWMQHYQTLIPDMLAGGVRVLIYAGDVDFICNYMGNKAWTLALDWPHHSDFVAAGDNAWYVDGQQAGLARTASNFTFLQVFEAGHMVPMDQPQRSLAMLQTFLDNKRFY